MVDLALTEPLGGHDTTIGGVRIRERGDLALVSVAAPLDSDIGLPPPGRSTEIGNGIRLVHTAPDQAMALLTDASADPEATVRQALPGPAYTTLQTHGWVVLEVSGTPVRRALERICPIDLHPDRFPVDAAARTVMEHLGVLIIHVSPDVFLLCSAASSARSFLHAVEVSASAQA